MKHRAPWPLLLFLLFLGVTHSQVTASFEVSDAEFSSGTNSLQFTLDLTVDANTVAVLFLSKQNPSTETFSLAQNPCATGNNNIDCTEELFQNYTVISEYPTGATSYPITLANPASGDSRFSSLKGGDGIDSGTAATTALPGSTYSYSSSGNNAHQVSLLIPISVLEAHSIFTDLGGTMERYEFFLGAVLIMLSTTTADVSIVNAQTNLRFFKKDYSFVSVSTEQERVPLEQVFVSLHEGKSSLDGNRYQYMKVDVVYDEDKYDSEFEVHAESVRLAKVASTSELSDSTWQSACAADGYYFSGYRAGIDAMATQNCLPKQPNFCNFGPHGNYWVPFPLAEASNTAGYIAGEEPGKSLYVQFVLQLTETSTSKKHLSTIYFSIDLSVLSIIRHCENIEIVYNPNAALDIRTHIGLLPEEQSPLLLYRTKYAESSFLDQPEVNPAARRLLQAYASDCKTPVCPGVQDVPDEEGQACVQSVLPATNESVWTFQCKTCENAAAVKFENNHTDLSCGSAACNLLESLGTWQFFGNNKFNIAPGLAPNASVAGSTEWGALGPPRLWKMIAHRYSVAVWPDNRVRKWGANNLPFDALDSEITFPHRVQMGSAQIENIVQLETSSAEDAFVLLTDMNNLYLCAPDADDCSLGFPIDLGAQHREVKNVAANAAGGFLVLFADGSVKSFAPRPARPVAAHAPTASAHANLERGLVAHFTFDDGSLWNTAPSPGEGLTHLKKGGSMLYNSVTPGRVGSSHISMERDAGALYLGSPEHPVLPTGTGTCTVVMWVKPLWKLNTFYRIFEIRSASNQVVLFLNMNGGSAHSTGFAYTYFSGGDYRATKLPVGRWSHVVVTANSITNTYEIFWNGNRVASDIRPAGTSLLDKEGGAYFSIGSYFTVDTDSGEILSFSHSSPFQFDDVRLYDRVLSASEIKQLCPPELNRLEFALPFDAPARDVDLNDGLVLWLPFDENFNDFSGYANTPFMTENGIIDQSLPKVGEGSLLGGLEYSALTSTEIDWKTGVSLSFWIKIRSLYTYQDLFYFHKTGTIQGFRLGLRTTNKIQIYFTGHPSAYVTTCNNCEIPLSAWTHITFKVYQSVTDPSKMEGSLLVNNELQQTFVTSSGMHALQNTYYLMLLHTNSDYPMNFDDVRLYYKQLSTEEIYALYELGLPQPIVHPRVDLRDHSGYGNPVAQISGTPPSLARSSERRRVGEGAAVSRDAGYQVQYGTALDVAGMVSSEGFSFSVWLKKISDTGNNDILSFHISSLSRIVLFTCCGNDHYRMNVYTRSNGGNYLGAGGDYHILPVNAPMYGTWYHVTASISSSNEVIVFVNGVQTIAFTADAFVSGDYFVHVNNLFGISTLLDDVRVFSRALSSADVAHLYAMRGFRQNIQPFRDRVLPAIAPGRAPGCGVLASRYHNVCAIDHRLGKAKCLGKSSNNWGITESAETFNLVNQNLGWKNPYVPLGDDFHVVQMVGTKHTSAFLSSDGLVKVVGGCSTGQCGTGNNNAIYFNTLIAGISSLDFGEGRKVKQLAASKYAYCALMENGKVICWGKYNSNALGRAVISETEQNHIGDAPGEFPDLLEEVDFGGDGTLTAKRLFDQGGGNYDSHGVILSNGNLVVWGAHAKIRKDDTGLNPEKPTFYMPTDSKVVQACMGAYHLCALFDDGIVRCAGSAPFAGPEAYKFEPNANNPSEFPAIDLGTGFYATEIACDWKGTCAKNQHGKVKCWGDASSGRLGYGDIIYRGHHDSEMGDNLPFVDLGENRHVVEIHAGSTNAFCALLDDASVKCWGRRDLPYGYTDSRLDLGDNPNEMGDALPALDLGFQPTCLGGGLSSGAGGGVEEGAAGSGGLNAEEFTDYGVVARSLPVVALDFQDASNPGYDSSPYSLGNATSTSFPSVTSTFTPHVNAAFSAYFDGVSSYLQLPARYLPNELTLSVWFHPYQQANGYQPLIILYQNYAQTGVPYRIVLSQNGGTSNYIFNTQNANSQTTSSSGNTRTTVFSIVFSSWNFFAISIDASGNWRCVFPDGTSQLLPEHRAIYDHIFYEDIFVGTNPTFSNFYQGYISNLKIHNHALTFGEMQEIRRATNPGSLQPCLASPIAAAERFSQSLAGGTAARCEGALNDGWALDEAAAQVCSDVEVVQRLDAEALLDRLTMDSLDDGGRYFGIYSIDTSNGLSVLPEPTIVPGIVGVGALELNDKRGFISTHPSLIGGTTYSISLWIRRANDVSVSWIWNIHTRFRITSNGLLQVWIGPETPAFTHIFKINVWYHIVYQWENDNHYLFVNGNYDSGLSFTTGTVGEFRFGFYTSVDTFPNYRGAMDDVRIYNRMLSDAEISALYRYRTPQRVAGVPALAAERELVRVTFEEGSGAFNLADTYLSLPDVHYRFDDATNLGRDSAPSATSDATSTSWPSFDGNVRRRGVGSAYFDGIDDIIQLPSRTFSSATTFALWFRPSATSVLWAKVFHFLVSDVIQPEYRIQLEQQGNLPSTAYNFNIRDSGTTQHQIQFSVTLEAWNFFSISIDQSGNWVSLEPNGGSQVFTGQNTIYIGAQYTRNSIGKHALSDLGEFTGHIDSFQIFDRALSLEEMKAVRDSLYEPKLYPPPSMGLSFARAGPDGSYHYGVSSSPETGFALGPFSKHTLRASGLTVSLWVRWDGDDPTDPFLGEASQWDAPFLQLWTGYADDGVVGHHRTVLRHLPASNELQLEHNYGAPGSALAATATSPYPTLSTWTHLALVFNGTNGVKTYRDGQLWHDLPGADVLGVDVAGSEDVLHIDLVNPSSLTKGLLMYIPMDVDYHDYSSNGFVASPMGGYGVPTITSDGIVGSGSAACLTENVVDQDPLNDNTETSRKGKCAIQYTPRLSVLPGTQFSYSVSTWIRHDPNLHDDFTGGEAFWRISMIDSQNIVLGSIRLYWNKELRTLWYKGSSFEAGKLGFLNAVSIPWTHTVVSITQNSNSHIIIKTYLNSTLVNTIQDCSICTTPSSQVEWQVELFHGAYAGSIYNSQLDDFRLYDRTLSNKEILQLYNLGASGKSTRFLGGVDSLRVFSTALHHGEIEELSVSPCPTGTGSPNASEVSQSAFLDFGGLNTQVGAVKGSSAGLEAGRVRANEDLSSASLDGASPVPGHQCVLLSNGDLRCFGSNTHGQLGLGDTIDRARGVANSPLDDPGRLSKQGLDQLPAAATGVLDFCTGGAHTCALFENYQAKCWGDNTFGQLGYQDRIARGAHSDSLPASLPYLDLPTFVSKIECTVRNTHALLQNGKVLSWGQSPCGEDGIGNSSTAGVFPPEEAYAYDHDMPAGFRDCFDRGAGATDSLTIAVEKEVTFDTLVAAKPPSVWNSFSEDFDPESGITPDRSGNGNEARSGPIVTWPDFSSFDSKELDLDSKSLVFYKSGDASGLNGRFEAQVSTFYNSGGAYAGWNMFQDIGESGAHWEGSRYNPDTGYFKLDETNSIDSSYKGDWLSLKFPRRFRADTFKFTERDHTCCEERFPEDVKFYGRNYDGETWTLIAHETAASPNVDIIVENRGFYYQYAFICNKIVGGHEYADLLGSIMRWYFTGAVERQPVAVPPAAFVLTEENVIHDTANKVATFTVTGQPFLNGLTKVGYSTRHSSVSFHQQIFCLFFTCQDDNSEYPHFESGQYSSGLYIGSNELVPGYGGDYATITLPEPIHPVLARFEERTISRGRAPGKFRLYGRNADSEPWVTIHDQSSTALAYTEDSGSGTSDQATFALDRVGLCVDAAQCAQDDLVRALDQHLKLHVPFDGDMEAVQSGVTRGVYSSVTAWTPTFVQGGVVGSHYVQKTSTTSSENHQYSLPTPIDASTSGFTLAFWVKVGCVPSYDRLISLSGDTVKIFVDQDDTSACSDFKMIMQGNSNQGVNTNLGWFTASHSTKPWVHVGLVIETNYFVRGYLDGAQVFTYQHDPAEFNNLQNLQDWRLGGYYGGQYSLDDLRMYDHALTATEILALYQYRSPHRYDGVALRGLARDRLLVHLPFDGDAENKAAMPVSGISISENSQTSYTFSSTGAAYGTQYAVTQANPRTNMYVGRLDRRVLEATGFTVSTWAKIDTLDDAYASYATIFRVVWESSGGLQIRVYFDPTDMKINFQLLDKPTDASHTAFTFASGATRETSVSAQLNTWYHVALAAEPGIHSVHCYVGGELVGSFSETALFGHGDYTETGDDSVVYDSVDFYVQDGNSNAFTGGVDDFRLYAAALTQSEIKQLIPAEVASFQATAGQYSQLAIAVSELTGTQSLLNFKRLSFPQATFAYSTLNLTDTAAGANGAAGAVRALHGKTWNELIWPQGTIPAPSGTICVASRWTDTTETRRILSSTSESNYMIGHRPGYKGSVLLGNTANNLFGHVFAPSSNSGTKTEWVVVCVSYGTDAPSSPGNVIFEETEVGERETSSALTDTTARALAVNNFSPDHLSNFAIHTVFCWSQALSTNEMKAVTSYLRLQLNHNHGFLPRYSFTFSSLSSALSCTETNAAQHVYACSGQNVAALAVSNASTPAQCGRLKRVAARTNLTFSNPPLTSETYQESTLKLAVAVVAEVEQDQLSLSVQYETASNIVSHVKVTFEDDGRDSLAGIDAKLSGGLQVFLDSTEASDFPDVTVGNFSFTTTATLQPATTRAQAASYAQAAIAVIFDGVDGLRGTGNKIHIDDCLIFNFLSAADGAEERFDRVRGLVASGNAFAVAQEVPQSGHSYYQMTPKFGSADSGLPCNQRESFFQSKLSDADKSCFYRRAVVNGETQDIAKKSIHVMTSVDPDSQSQPDTSAQSFIKNNIIDFGGSTTVEEDLSVDKYYTRTCNKLTQQPDAGTLVCAYFDPGFRWITNSDANADLDPFTLADKAIITFLISIRDDTGAVQRRRLLSVDHTRRTLLSHDLVAEEKGESGAVSFTIPGVQPRKNMLSLTRTRGARWQYATIRTWRRSDVALPLFLRNAKLGLYAIAHRLGASFHREEPYTFFDEETLHDAHPQRRLLGYSDGVTRNGVNISTIFHLADFSSGYLYEAQLQCLFHEIASKPTNLTLSQATAIAETCAGYVYSLDKWGAIINVTLEECGDDTANHSPVECLQLASELFEHFVPTSVDYSVAHLHPPFVYFSAFLPLETLQLNQNISLLEDYTRFAVSKLLSVNMDRVIAQIAAVSLTHSELRVWLYPDSREPYRSAPVYLYAHDLRVVWQEKRVDLANALKRLTALKFIEFRTALTLANQEGVPYPPIPPLSSEHWVVFDLWFPEKTLTYREIEALTRSLKLSLYETFSIPYYAVYLDHVRSFPYHGTTRLTFHIYFATAGEADKLFLELGRQRHVVEHRALELAAQEAQAHSVPSVYLENIARTDIIVRVPAPPLHPPPPLGIIIAGVVFGVVLVLILRLCFRVEDSLAQQPLIPHAIPPGGQNMLRQVMGKKFILARLDMDKEE